MYSMSNNRASWTVLMVCGSGNLSHSFLFEVISSSLPLHFSNLSPSALECFHFQHSLKNCFFPLHLACTCIAAREYFNSHTHTQNGFHQIECFFSVAVLFPIVFFDAAGFYVCSSKKLDGILVDFVVCALWCENRRKKLHSIIVVG